MTEQRDAHSQGTIDTMIPNQPHSQNAELHLSYMGQNSLIGRAVDILVDGTGNIDRVWNTRT